MRKWLIVILALAWLIWELVGAIDGPGNIWTLTEIIRTYVPYEVTMTGVAVLIAWLPVHFARRSEGGAMRYSKFIVAGLVAGLTVLASAVSDDKVTVSEWVNIGLATVGAIGVLLVPNKPAPDEQVDYLRGRNQTS